jgi:hypothetical protein
LEVTYNLAGSSMSAMVAMSLCTYMYVLDLGL